MPDQDTTAIGDQIRHTRQLRARLQSDPHRPTYHFVVPEGPAMPFDPNGCIFWKGKYHLFYIFQDPDLPHGGHCWGHASSIDLVHWTLHPTALAPAPDDPDVGIFSGNAFVNKDGVPTIAYLGVQAGICIATADDDDLLHWTKCPENPVIPIPKEGESGHGQYNVHDPHAWVDGDTYYVGLNGRVLPKNQYDTLYLFKSQDLVHWEYLHRLYEPNPEWTDPEEDCACPDLFKLGDRHMLLCISHPRGARYYLGRYENETFHPEEHHRMNWPGGTCFAPESLLDDRGRRIFWAWVMDRRDRDAAEASGWSGVMTLPRVLSLDGDGSVRIEPAEELKTLRLNHRRREDIQLADTEVLLDDMAGDRLELAIEMEPQGASECGITVRCSPDGAEQTVITFDPGAQSLKIDLSESTLDKTVTYRSICCGSGENPEVQAQEAPFELKAGEPLRVRMFLDRSILEVFANGRQCLTQRIYPTRDDSLGVSVFGRGGSALVNSMDAWDMAAANVF